MTLTECQVYYLEKSLASIREEIKKHSSDMAKVIRLGSELVSIETLLILHRMEQMNAKS